MKITRINVLLGQPAEGPTNCPAGLSLAQPSARCLRIRLLRGTGSFSAPRRAHLTREKAQVSSAPPEPPVPFSVAGRIRTPGRSLSHAAEGKRATGAGAGGASNAERSCLRGSLQSGGAPGIHHALRSQQNRAVEGSHRILLQKRGPHLCLSRRRLGRSERRLPEHAGPQQLPLFLGGLS